MKKIFKNHDLDRLTEQKLFDEGLKKRRNEKKRTILQASCLIVFLFILFFTYLLAAQFFSSNVRVSRIVDNNQTASQENSWKNILPDVLQKTSDQEPFSILALGRPGKGYSGSNLTDTIILTHFIPADKKAYLISLPRDLLVKVADNSTSSYRYWGKINGLYNSLGIDVLKDKIEDITGITTDHYIIVDLVVVEEIINTIDGLNVFVPEDIYDPFFPGFNYTYEPFSIKSGWRYLDGKTALRYIRTRYTSPNGDFDRMARQQQIIHLLKQKVLSLNPLWDLPVYLKIFETLQSHITTDLSIWQIKSIWQTIKDIDPNKIRHIVVDKKETDLLTGSSIMIGPYQASVILPKEGQGQYENIRKYIQEAINQ